MRSNFENSSQYVGLYAISKKSVHFWFKNDPLCNGIVRVVSFSSTLLDSSLRRDQVRREEKTQHDSWCHIERKYF